MKNLLTSGCNITISTGLEIKAQIGQTAQNEVRLQAKQIVAYI